jgi:hypothetical protein
VLVQTDVVQSRPWQYIHVPTVAGAVLSTDEVRYGYLGEHCDPLSYLVHYHTRHGQRSKRPSRSRSVPVYTFTLGTYRYYSGDLDGRGRQVAVPDYLLGTTYSH